MDRNTPVPGAGSNTKFNGFNWPAYDGTNIAFQAYLNDGTQGIYRWSGSLTQLAVSGSNAPGGNESFVGFSGPSLDAGKIAFHALLSINSNEGIFSDASGSLQRVLDKQQTIPPTGAGTVYHILGKYPSIGNGATAFDCSIAPWPNGAALCLAPSTMLVSNQQTMPGTQSLFQNIRGPIRDGNRVIFFGNDNSSTIKGIYLYDSGTLTAVASTSTPIPGGVGNFTDFLGHDLQGTSVCFYGLGTGGYSGLFLWSGGQITKIVDTNTNAPSGGKFNTFGYGNGAGPTLQNGSVVFTASNTNWLGPGLYTNYGGSLQQILIPGDPLDGGTVQGCSVTPYGLRDGQVAVRISTSTNVAIYLVDLDGDIVGCATQLVLRAARELNPLKTVFPDLLTGVEQREQLLTDLRRFRDDVLTPSSLGRQLADEYYTHGRTVAATVAGQPELLIEAVKLLEEVRQALAPVTTAEPVVRLPRETFARGLRWLDGVQAEVSPEAAEAIAGARQLLVGASRQAGEVIEIRFNPELSLGRIDLNP